MNLGLNAEAGPFNVVGGLNSQVNEQRLDMSAGVEYTMGVASLRAAYQGGSGGAIKGQDGAARYMQGLTTGMGLKIANMKLDYALGQTSQEVCMSHRLALTVQFGKKQQ